MKFAVGYQLPGEDDEPMVEIIADYAEHIAEVYFPWADMPSGRAPLASRRGYTDWTAQRELERDLVRLRGGQGTMNVNSWAPDSRRLAYVDYPIGD